MQIGWAIDDIYWEANVQIVRLSCYSSWFRHFHTYGRTERQTIAVASFRLLHSRTQNQYTLLSEFQCVQGMKSIKSCKHTHTCTWDLIRPNFGHNWIVVAFSSLIFCQRFAFNYFMQMNREQENKREGMREFAIGWVHEQKIIPIVVISAFRTEINRQVAQIFSCFLTFV